MSPELGAKVIAIAQGLVGSHYINGGYGATPGRSDGCPCRPGGMTLIADEKHLDPAFKATNKAVNLAVKAATMTIKTYCVCAGHYANPSVNGRETTPDAPDLVEYLDSLKGTPPSSWPNCYGSFTPRRTFGPGQNGGDGHGRLVWGKACTGIRHFDCVGFISYCYWKASGSVVQLDISAWRKPGGAGRSSIWAPANDQPASKTATSSSRPTTTSPMSAATGQSSRRRTRILACARRRDFRSASREHGRIWCA